jgi:hypothetical protein
MPKPFLNPQNPKEVLKVCAKCDETKNIINFYVHTNRNGKKALNSYCKECWSKITNQIRSKNPIKHKMRNALYYQNNKEYYRNYWQNNKDKRSEGNLRYRIKEKLGGDKNKVGSRTDEWIDENETN